MLQLILSYKQELQKLYESGKSLKEISRYSYQQRESGRNIPYMAITDPTRVTAAPVKKQRELYDFFYKNAADSNLPEYQLYVDTDEGGVILKHRFGRGKDNFELL